MRAFSALSRSLTSSASFLSTSLSSSLSFSVFSTAGPRPSSLTFISAFSSSISFSLSSFSSPVREKFKRAVTATSLLAKMSASLFSASIWSLSSSASAASIFGDFSSEALMSISCAISSFLSSTLSRLLSKRSVFTSRGFILPTSASNFILSVSALVASISALISSRISFCCRS